MNAYLIEIELIVKKRFNSKLPPLGLSMVAELMGPLLKPASPDAHSKIQ